MDMDNVTIENMRASCLIDINEVSQLEPSHIASIYSDRISETQVSSAWNEGYPNVPEEFTITEKAPTRAFSWLKAPTTAFTFKTLLRHYAIIRDRLKDTMLTKPPVPYDFCIYLPWGQRPFSIVS